MNYLDCPHERSVIRVRKDAAGRAHFKTQCLDCGHYGKNGAHAISRDHIIGRGVDPAAVPAFDEAAFSQAEQSATDDWTREMLAERERRRAERAPYYASAAWRECREKVMRRAGGICEGCLERPATQVHHLTYDNFGAEFMWELRAVCEPCHERIHEHHHAQEAEDRARLLNHDDEDAA